MIVVLLNPTAGGGKTSDLSRNLEAMFASAGAPARVVLLQSPARTADDVRRAVQAGATVVVAGGGDGTVSTVAAAALEAEATLGVLPLGTLNHFARDLGMPQDLEQAVGAIAAGHRSRVDVGEVNGRPFINNASIGIYPDIVLEREALRARGLRKWTAFAVATTTVLRRFHGVLVRVSSEASTETFRTPFLFIGNNEYQLEGISAGTRRRLDGGKLHVYVAPRTRARDLPILATAALIGGAARNPSLRAFATASLDVGTPGRRHLHVALDGEVMHMAPPLRFRIRERALEVVAPEPGAAADEENSGG